MYMVSPWTTAVQELSTKATTHSGATLTSKGSEHRAMPVQCQNIPATICICSGTVLGCSEASVSPEVVESFFLLLADFDESPSPEVQTPPGGREPILFGWFVGVCQTDYKLLRRIGECIRLAKVSVPSYINLSLLTWSHVIWSGSFCKWSIYYKVWP